MYHGPGFRAYEKRPQHHRRRAPPPADAPDEARSGGRPTSLRLSQNTPHGEAFEGTVGLERRAFRGHPAPVRAPAGDTLTMRTVVYVDGGCDPNPGPGGWGVVVVAEAGHLELCGGDPRQTTNNRMELTAAIKALEHFRPGASIEIRCDSQYVVKAMNEWMRNWKRKNWGGVANVDLMQRLDALNAERDVKWTWVRGHAGDPLNERADALVHRGRREARQGATEARSEAAAPASAPRMAAVQVDLALGLDVSRAAKAEGTAPDALVADAIRLYLNLGPVGVARARDFLRRRSEAA